MIHFSLEILALYLIDKNRQFQLKFFAISIIVLRRIIDATAVSRFAANLKSLLSGVSEHAFQRLNEGLIADKTCGMSGERASTNNIYW
jgi:hypothetical protein